MTAMMPIHPGPRKLVDGFDQGSSAWRNTFMSATKLATFEPVAIQAVTGAGAPSYASGAHWWNGTAAILNPNPTRIRSTAVAPARFPERPDGPCSSGGRTWRMAPDRVLPLRP